jgi:hypothetical protein
MITETSAANFRQNLGEMHKQVPERFAVLCARITTGFADVPEEQGLAEIEAAIVQERALCVVESNREL